MNAPLGIAYADGHWPHGLRCGDCHREMVDGDRYSEQLDRFSGDTPVVRVVCVVCALAPATGDVQDQSPERSQ